MWTHCIDLDGRLERCAACPIRRDRLDAGWLRCRAKLSDEEGSSCGIGLVRRARAG